jgi:hypothetical protein
MESADGGRNVIITLLDWPGPLRAVRASGQHIFTHVARPSEWRNSLTSVFLEDGTDGSL